MKLSNPIVFPALLMLSLLLPLALSPSAAADIRYQSSVIELSGELDHYRVADFNGDGLQDVLVSTRTETADDDARELLVYYQQPGGKFPGRPSKRIELKKDIVAYGIADSRAEPGDELLFFSRTAFFGFSTASESYANNLQRLGDWSLIETIPNARSVSYIGPFTDLNGDGKVDLLLPSVAGYGLFYGTDKGFEFVTQLPAPLHHPQAQRATGSIGFDSRRGLLFLVENANTRQPLVIAEDADNLKGKPQDEEQSRLLRNNNPLLHWERWQAAMFAQDLTNNQRQDFLFVDDFPEADYSSQTRPDKRLNLVLHSPDTKKMQQSSYSLPIAAGSIVQLGDWNNDKFADLMLLNHGQASEATVSFFPNSNGRLNTKTAAQVMKFSGNEVDVELVDVNNDGQMELLVSYYSLSAVDAVRSGNMLRTTLLYESAGESGGAFQRRPSMKLEEKFSSATFRGLTQRLKITDDIDGDGINDALSVDSDGALIARRFAKNLQLQESPLWRFLPLHVITWLQPLALNNDKRADIILSHQNALTVLISSEVAE